MTTTTSCITRDAEVPLPALRLNRNDWAEMNSIFDRIQDLTVNESRPPTLRQANRLLLAYFLVLDVLNDESACGVKRSALGQRMSRHCDAIYCSLSYEFNSQDGDMGDMWIPLRTDIQRLLAHIFSSPRAD
jgi:hypothetical protein